MKRRDFLTKSIGAGILTGTGLALGNIDNIFASGKLMNLEEDYDLTAVMGGEPDIMFSKAIAAMGGMQKYVKKGQKVLVKPNIGWDSSPEKAADTNPVLIKCIIEHCMNAGAKEVVVFDNTCDNWQRCYSNSGIEKAVKDAGGKMAPGNNESNYHPVKVPKGKKLKDAKEHELVLESDVFINVPVLKIHGGAQLSISMKNLMGIVWDRGYWHKHDLQQCIADYITYRKPTLNVVDAYRAMKKNGPRGGSLHDVVLLKSLIISEDIVAADAAASKLIGFEPKSVDHIRIASEMGLGRLDLEKLKINKIKVA
jgi:uncharacterized protein (DUF362 family)